MSETQNVGITALPLPAGVSPFRVEIPQEAIVDLRRRLGTAKLPEKETVSDSSQGVQLATMKELVRYWGAEYDWRKVETKLNALPQFITNIDGLDIPLRTLMDWTSTSFTFARNMKMLCRSSLRMGGRVRSSSR